MREAAGDNTFRCARSLAAAAERPGGDGAVRLPLLPGGARGPGAGRGRGGRAAAPAARRLSAGLAGRRCGRRLARRGRPKAVRIGRSPTSACTGATSSSSPPGTASSGCWPRPPAAARSTTVLFSTDAGASGSMLVSQTAIGRRNALRFSLDGADAAYAFDQEHPETLLVGGLERQPGAAPRVTRDFRGGGALLAAPAWASAGLPGLLQRLRRGHLRRDRRVRRRTGCPRSPTARGPPRWWTP